MNKELHLSQESKMKKRKG